MALPSGTVTFLFTDIEGSTRLLQRLGDAYGDVQTTHHRLLRETAEAHDGHEVDSQGDALFFSFPRARDAVAGAIAAQAAFAAHDWPEGVEVKVRMGLHTGEPTLGEEGYHGLDVVRAARICAAGHGGQVLISETTRALLGNEVPEGATIYDLGEQNLKDIQREHVFQVVYEGQVASAFPPLRTADERPVDTKRMESLATTFEARIEETVLRSIEESLGGGDGARPPKPAHAIAWAATGLVILFLSVATIAAIVWLIVQLF